MEASLLATDSNDSASLLSRIEFLREELFAMPLDGEESQHNLNQLEQNFTTNIA